MVKYQFVLVSKEIQELKKGQEKLVPSVKTFLCIKDLETGMIYPHPLTNFIKSKFDNISLANNTQISYGGEIKKFLNYILESIEDEDELFLSLEEDGINGINLYHGASYISFLTQKSKLGEMNPEGVFRAERLLVIFYEWLNDQNILKEKITIKQETKTIQGNTTTTLISPFRNIELGTTYPNKRDSKQQIKERRLHDFGAGRLDLVNLFIRVAELEAPDIALGIAFQFYGGLRRGEVVNLLRKNVKEPKKNRSSVFTLKIQDNWDKLFPKKALTVSEQVKKPREQPIFTTQIVEELYEKHKKILTRLEKKGKIKDKTALFVSKHTGKPISGIAYWKRFNKVKKRFLDIVLDIDDDDYTHLTSKDWSTHIGRGIYTNLITFLLRWNPTELAIARGDDSVESAQSYVEEQNVIRMTEEATETIASAIKIAEHGKYATTIEEIRGIL